jgi:hypothetical protein
MEEKAIVFSNIDLDGFTGLLIKFAHFKKHPERRGLVGVSAFFLLQIPTTV